MKTPDDIDSLIYDDIKGQERTLYQIDMEQRFHLKTLDELKRKIGCEHEREMWTTTHDHCRHCGYAWAR